MKNASYFRSDDDVKIKYIYIYSHNHEIIEKIWFNLRHTLYRIYMASVLEIQYLSIDLHNDDNEVV